MKEYILFVTSTCPKCPEMKEYVNSLRMEGTIIDETHNDFTGFLERFGVTTAPTLILFDSQHDGSCLTELFRGSEVQEIKDFLA